MEAKKNPRYSLDAQRGIFFNIGLIISILFVISAFEWKFYDEEMIVEAEQVEQQAEQIIPITEQPPPEPPRPKVVAKEFIEVVAEEEIDIPEIDIVIDQVEMATYEPPPVLEVPEVIEEEVSDEPFLIVEEMPVPVGGYEAFYAHVKENLKYPSSARNLGVQGKVFVKFVVDERGEITNLEVIKGIGAGCDEEAVRVIKSGPKWKAGKQRGRSVKVQIVMPIRFMIHEIGT